MEVEAGDGSWTLTVKTRLASKPDMASAVQVKQHAGTSTRLNSSGQVLSRSTRPWIIYDQLGIRYAIPFSSVGRARH